MPTVSVLRALQQYLAAARSAAGRSSSCTAGPSTATATTAGTWSRSLGSSTKAASEAFAPQQASATTYTALQHARQPARHYLPAAAAVPQQLSISISTGGPEGQAAHTQIVFINGAAGAAAAASWPTAATAAAAGHATWPPSLHSWLFGFACGTTAATAAAYNYLGTAAAAPSAAAAAPHWQQQHQHHLQSSSLQGTAAAAAGLPHDHHVQQSLTGMTNSSTVTGSPSSSSRSSSGPSSSNDGIALNITDILTKLSLPGRTSNTDSSSSSSSSSGVVTEATGGSSGSSNPLRGLWGFLSGLGATAAQAAAPASASQPPSAAPGQGLLPTPWEHPGSSSSAGSSGSSGVLPPEAGSALAAAAGSSSGSNAVMLRSSISEAAAAAAPAVVHLVATSGPGAAAGAHAGGHYGAWESSRAQGSGFIYDPAGFILTNAHVVLGTAPPLPLSASTTAAAAAAAHTAATAATAARTGFISNLWPRGSSSSRQQQQHSSDSPIMLHNSSSSCDSNGSRPTAAAAVEGGSSGAVSRVLVHMSDGRVFEGRVVALDRPSDLAVVAVDAGAEDLPAVKLGESRRLRVGEWVVALGSPFLLKQSVTAGIVSCVERKGSELGLNTCPRTEFIQTDASINVGNSGGPLVNLDGEVVAMNVMKAAAADGVSFAIPIDSIKQLVSEISRHGRVRRPYAGITMAEVGQARLAQLRTSCPDFPTSVRSGIVVTRVTPGSPAAAAGLTEDDVIVGLAERHQGVVMGNHSKDKGADVQQQQPQQQQQQEGQPVGLSVAEFADALKASIGGSLDLLVVREAADRTQRAPPAAAAGSSGKAGVLRAAEPGGKSSSVSGVGVHYEFVTVTLRPVEAAAS